MKNTYDVYSAVTNSTPLKRAGTTTNWQEAQEIYSSVEGPKRITVTNNLTNQVQHLNNDDDIEGWQTCLERSIWLENVEQPRTALFEKQKRLAKETAQINEAREDVGLPPLKDHINPSHYQAYFSMSTSSYSKIELQWLEAAQYRQHWRDPEKFKAAVMLQADKYLSRLGGKDEAVQELKKAIWYLEFLAAFIANGDKPIRVTDIPKLLNK